jgi:UPF0755 protein
MQRTRSGFVKRLGLGLCGLAALSPLYLWLYYHAPAGRTGEPQIVTIAPGAGVQQIAAQLAQAGVIRHRGMFLFYVTLTRAASRLQAGEYALRSTMSPAQIIDTLRYGRVVRHALTIPEGSTLRDIAGLTTTRGLGSRQDLLALAYDAWFIASLGFTAPSLEGYLFPDTYRVPRGITARALLTLMVRTLRDHYTTEIAARGRHLGLTQHEVLTLASLIEKEARVDEERALIAAVFHNRLRRGMRLECDATVIYALGERFDGNLRKEDLQVDSPYNTYRYAGLPPGPIANPGRRSLEAAVAPAPVDYLYFVATKQQGTHQFSTSLEEHNRAVRQYQLSTQGRP